MWWNSPESGEPRKPVVYDTKKKAYEEMLEDHINSLSAQLDDLKCDARDPDDVEMDYDGWVAECQVDDDGVIHTANEGIVYDPKNPATW
ncbi:MAG TPA: hypothetical protein PKI55_06325 [Chitinophagaceae bacterium]|nr:hypothetical protein [Chitinophagaceae bacterium]